MLNVKHILFPVDFSERCGAIAPHVASMAQRFGAKITLLNVIQSSWVAPMADAPAIYIDIEEIRKAAEVSLKESFCDQFAGMEIDRRVTDGDPATEIVNYAEQNDVGLIMMPTHGYGPFREFLLGSVTAKVLHDSTKPVWTSAHIKGPDTLVHVDTRTILCATDALPCSEPLIRQAADFAISTGAKLRLVHVTPAPSGWPDYQIDQQFEHALVQEARKEINKIITTLPLQVPLCIHKGSVATGVRDAAERFSADLVIIGRGVLKERLGRLRTNAYAIIRNSPCPVLSI